MAFNKKASFNKEEDIFSEEIVKAGALSATRKITIGVAGCMPRIGTTTQALHITQYLFYQNRNVAYVELADRGFIDKLIDTTEGVKYDKDGNAVYQRLTLVKKDNLTSLSKNDYEFIVYDYGHYFDLGMTKDRKTNRWQVARNANFPAAFESCNVQILCGGTSPEEYLYTTFALREKTFRSAKVMFTACPKDDMGAILEMMTGKQSETFFAAYAPDMFNYKDSMDPTYAQILPELD